MTSQGQVDYQISLRTKDSVVPVESCIPVIPSKDIEKSLCFWVDGLGF